MSHSHRVSYEADASKGWEFISKKKTLAQYRAGRKPTFNDSVVTEVAQDSQLTRLAKQSFLPVIEEARASSLLMTQGAEKIKVRSRHNNSQENVERKSKSIFTKNYPHQGK